MKFKKRNKGSHVKGKVLKYERFSVIYRLICMLGMMGE